MTLPSSRTSDETIVLIRSRRTHAPVAFVEDWTDLYWTQAWRGSGTGLIAIRAEHVTREMLEHLADGDGGIEIRRTRIGLDGREHVDHVLATATAVTVEDGTYDKTTFDIARVINEVIVLGDGEQADRSITRVFDADSQERFGLKERTFDKRNYSTELGRQIWGGIKLVEASEVAEEHEGGGDPGKAGPVVKIFFRDVLGYANDRYTDNSGIAEIVTATQAASAYIEALWRTQLIAPDNYRDKEPGQPVVVDSVEGRARSARRTIDTPARVVVANPAVGENVTLPLRWRHVGEAIRQACTVGEVGVTYSFDGERITYQVKAPRDRTAGADRVIYSQPWSQQDWGILPGDIVEAATYLHPDSPTPDFRSAPRLCVERRIHVRPGRSTRERLRFGAERLGADALFALVEDAIHDSLAR